MHLQNQTIGKACGGQMIEAKPSNIRGFLPKEAAAKYLAILSEVQKYQREIKNAQNLLERRKNPTNSSGDCR